MELIKQRSHNYTNINGQVELAVFDLVGQLLAIVLEKYDVEIIIESKDYWYDFATNQETDGFVKTIIACEEVIETDESIEIALCGEAKYRNFRHETFTLFLSLCLKDNHGDLLLKSDEKQGCVNSLWLQFGRKAEQLSDSIFKVVLVNKESDGHQEILGEGRGLLIFGRETTSKSN